MNLARGSRLVDYLKMFYLRVLRRFVAQSVAVAFDSDDVKSKDSIKKIFAINLDRQKNRWSHLQKELESQRVGGGKTLASFGERVSAVDGRRLNVSTQLSNEVQNLYSLREHFFIDPDPRLSHLVRSKDVKVSMSSAEIGVALSHVSVWRKIVEQKIPYALVLEDDIFFEDQFTKLLDNSWAELPRNEFGKKKFDLLYLSYREVDNYPERQAFSTTLFKPIRGFWWLSGYVLSHAGATKLLSSLPVRGPVDMWINLQFENLDVFACTRSIISQRRDWSSGNSYSIMPVLSRAGIHLDSKGKKHKKLISRTPVFAIGLNKTGTTSLHFALTLLGYKCCHWISEKFSDNTAKLIDNGEKLPFDAYTDVESVTEKYKLLDKQYPNAVFILTTRNISDWIASRSRHVIRNRTENSKGASHAWVDIDIELWKKERAEHHEAVQDYFKGRKNKLLILNICDGDEWGSLCKFLDLPIPDAAFPNVDPLIKLQVLSRSLMGRIPVSGRNSLALEHDNHPWIRQPEEISNYAGDAGDIKGFGNRTGAFLPKITESFHSISSAHWELLNDTFPYNLVHFFPDMVHVVPNGGLRLSLENRVSEHRDFASGSIRSQEEFQYGRFEAELKPAKASGAISAFFLYRIDPWQEIDIEFLGSDTTKMLVNVYYNPGEEGTVQNHGNSGTPVVIDLGFDASAQFHHYAIEWDPNEIRWFVDDELIHVRAPGRPTPIPDLPLKVYSNLWAPGSAKLAGKLDTGALPKTTEIRSVVISKWMRSEELDHIAAN